MKLSELLRLADIPFDASLQELEIGGLCDNTHDALKRINDTPLFVCIRGAKHDSHNDMAELARAGIKVFVAQKSCPGTECADASVITVEDSRIALAKLSRAYFGFPDEKLVTVAVTGTKGKTTTTYMLASIAEQQGLKCGIIGTNGIMYDGKVTKSENSTPGSLEFYRALYEMNLSGVTHLFCEVTSQALKQNRVCGTIFDVAAFTNLFPDHIGKDEHESFEEYRECKASLFRQCKKAVLCGDDGEFPYFRDCCTKFGTPFTVFSRSCADEKLVKSVKIPGEYNISNALCSAEIAVQLGISADAIYKGTASTRVPGRCERVENPAGVNIVIDYAHNKESLGNILEALRKHYHSDGKGKLICLFGAGGNRSGLRRSGMGETAAKLADFSIVTSDNPRGEELSDIIADILCGMTEYKSKYTVIPDRKEAIRYALSLAVRGDTVLLAGKGTQTFEEIKGIKYHLDEREEVSLFYKRFNPQ